MNSPIQENSAQSVEGIAPGAMTKEEVIQRLREEESSESKLSLIQQHYDLFNAKDIEELSSKIIDELKFSLEHYERFAGGYARKKPLGHFPEDLTKVVDGLRQELEGQISRERAAPSMSYHLPRVGAATACFETGVSTQETKSQTVAEEKAETWEENLPEEGSVLTSNHDMGAPQSSFSRVRGWNLRGLAIWAGISAVANALSIALVSKALGPNIAQLVPAVVWIAMCVLGARNEQAVAGLVVSITILFFYGWSVIQSVLTTIVMVPLGFAPGWDQIFLLVGLLAMMAITTLWRVLGQKIP